MSNPFRTFVRARYKYTGIKSEQGWCAAELLKIRMTADDIRDYKGYPEAKVVKFTLNNGAYYEVRLTLRDFETMMGF